MACCPASLPHVALRGRPAAPPRPAAVQQACNQLAACRTHLCLYVTYPISACIHHNCQLECKPCASCSVAWYACTLPFILHAPLLSCRLPGSNLLMGLPVVMDTNSEAIREGQRVSSASKQLLWWSATCNAPRAGADCDCSMQQEHAGSTLVHPNACRILCPGWQQLEPGAAFALHTSPGALHNT